MLNTMKEIVSTQEESSGPAREKVRNIAKQRLPELMRQLVQESQSATEMLIAEKQVISSTEVIQQSASEVSKKLAGKMDPNLINHMELGAATIATSLSKLPQ